MKINFLTTLALLGFCFSIHGNPFGYDSHSIFVTKVSESYEETYQEVLSQYSDYILNNPNDVIALTEKCQFIEAYVYSESSFVDVDSSNEDDLTECKAQLENFPENHPERLLYEISFLWGDEAIDKYEEIYNSGIDEWTNSQKVRFFQWMEDTQKWSNNYDSSISHSAYAETKDPQFALGAAIYEWENTNNSKALEVLEYQQAEAIEDLLKLAQLYFDLGLLNKAKEIIASIENESEVDEVEIIALKSAIDPEYYPSVDDIQAIKADWNGDTNLEKLFNHAIEIERYQSAETFYQIWASNDIWQDPFKYHKFKLYKASGVWNVNIQDLYSILIWLAVGIICFLMTFLIIAPIHYRGLYRRVHNKRSLESLTHWNLKHALFLATMFSLIGAVLYILYQYDSFYSMFFKDVELPFSSENGLNSKIYFIHAILMLLMSLLIIKHGKALFRVSVSDLLKSLLITAGVFLLFKFVFVTVMFAVKMSTLSVTIDIVELTITDINSNYGAIATFLTIAFLTPLIEEYLFRGVLLNSFTKHITFVWANIIQAGIFSLLHDSHYIHHFLLGMIVGYLVKVQKHLYGAILFHMLNNALAVSMIVF